MSPIDTVRVRLLQLSKRRPLFHDEADFQCELADDLSTSGSALLVEPERSFSVGAVDLYVEVNRIRLGIELKYRRKRFDGVVEGERYALKNGGALDHGSYDFWHDIHRLETLVDNDEIDVGAAILLTNDQGYWTSRPGPSAYQAFRPYEGRQVVAPLAWPEHSGKGSTRHRDAPIALRNTYTVGWADYRPDDGASYPNRPLLRFALIAVHR